MSGQRFEYEDNFNKVTIRSERFNDEVTIATRYHGNWQQLYMKPYDIREFARYLLKLADEIDPPVQFAPGIEEDNAAS